MAFNTATQANSDSISLWRSKNQQFETNAIGRKNDAAKASKIAKTLMTGYS